MLVITWIERYKRFSEYGGPRYGYKPFSTAWTTDGSRLDEGIQYCRDHLAKDPHCYVELRLIDSDTTLSDCRDLATDKCVKADILGPGKLRDCYLRPGFNVPYRWYSPPVDEFADEPLIDLTDVPPVDPPVDPAGDPPAKITLEDVIMAAKKLAHDSPYNQGDLWGAVLRGLGAGNMITGFREGLESIPGLDLASGDLVANDDWRIVFLRTIFAGGGIGNLTDGSHWGILVDAAAFRGMSAWLVDLARSYPDPPGSPYPVPRGWDRV